MCGMPGVKSDCWGASDEGGKAVGYTSRATSRARCIRNPRRLFLTPWPFGVGASTLVWLGGSGFGLTDAQKIKGPYNNEYCKGHYDDCIHPDIPHLKALCRKQLPGNGVSIPPYRGKVKG